ncbi:hypothetical protein [Butyrivibrio sp. VCD2006]|uniref:hypothetical protein n=1 Tax=Butyrivibrio sp. VCD2006 TaxID=1280664 RepID=UPI0004792A47|nr:hypothetical protein [Butyrivibrio sp. VCD2006]
MNKIKKYLFLIGLCIYFFGNSKEVIAKTPNVNTIIEDSIKRAKDIVTKTRRYHGKRQHRRWDNLNNKWIDPQWIDD